MLWWEILLIIIGFVLLVLGIIGSVAPILPGPPLSWASLWCLQLTTRYDITPKTLIITGVIMLIITVLDYLIPVLGTKYFGGTRGGTWGSAVGVIAAIFLFPITGLLGLILLPFAGAFVGERLADQSTQVATKSAFGALLGFLSGTIMKLLYGVVMTVIYVWLMF